MRRSKMFGWRLIVVRRHVTIELGLCYLSKLYPKKDFLNLLSNTVSMQHSRNCVHLQCLPGKVLKLFFDAVSRGTQLRVVDETHDHQHTFRTL